jgi:hypothetical protein
MEALMPLQMAFGITADDIHAVLKKYEDKVVNPNRYSIETMATVIYHMLSEEDMDDIALAAMDAFIDGRPESEGAHIALRKLLVRRGLLDMSRRAQGAVQTQRTKEKIDMAMAMAMAR